MLDGEELKELNDLAEQIKKEPITPRELLAAWDHPYTCTCSLCRKAWKSVGPDEDGLYGPFRKNID